MGKTMTASLRAKLLLLVGSLVFLVLLSLVGELVFRLFSNAQLMGISRNLFTADMYGASKGNTPNVEAIAFAEAVFTDGYGFRVPAVNDERDWRGEPALLVLGDSVAFGPGVPEEQTFAGLLRQSMEGQQVYNSAVIGYGAPNYLDVVNAWLPEHPEVHTVVLLFCLNDVSPVSARKIDEALGRAAQQPASDWVQAVKRIRVVEGLNGFLRSRSKLYLTARNVLTDPPKRYWDLDKMAYRDPAKIAKALQPILQIDEILNERGIRFLVVLSPHEYQLRTGAQDEELGLPQQVVTTILSEAAVEFKDALPYLRERGGASSYFMIGDPLHYAEAGHAAIHDFVLQQLGSN